MILPEDSGVAYEKVCDKLGYDAIGVPETEDDVEAFKQYRDSKQLGSLIVASVPLDLFNQHEVSLAHLEHYDLCRFHFLCIMCSKACCAEATIKKDCWKMGSSGCCQHQNPRNAGSFRTQALRTRGSNPISYTAA